MFNLGVNTNNECGKTYTEILNNIQAVGFTDVMVATKSGDLEECIENALQEGFNIPYVHLTNKFCSNLWVKGETNLKFIQGITKELQVCSKYRIPIAILHATHGNAEELALPPNEHGLNCMKQIIKVAKKLKVKIALENLDAPNFKNFTYLMDNINDPYLGFCYDAGHHNLYNPKVDLLKKYGNRILAVHLHDNLMDWEYGYDYTRDLHRLPFDGKIDYKKVIKKLAATPYKNTIMLELHKDSCGEPRIYNKMSPQEFLKEAHCRAEKLSKMLEEERNKKN